VLVDERQLLVQHPSLMLRCCCLACAAAFLESVISLSMVVHSWRRRHSSVTVLLSQWSTSYAWDSAQRAVPTALSTETSPGAARRGCHRTNSSSSTVAAAAPVAVATRGPEDVTPAAGPDKVVGSLAAGSCTGETCHQQSLLAQPPQKLETRLWPLTQTLARRSGAHHHVSPLKLPNSQ
jgi:hypothetical protein